ncbi:TatD family hydrolase [Gillisia limnaea]|uniref:Hydrolase, TatD family n=1 Tax=Gillisia limnaea (strain DSM 15749 / LMG 21470 / R-8282) TaxID=865937 RepID=H2BX65_GILLR|nr:TatD family hydrolase [Gillisia limnaea]EHQ03055.1 hydrolase, TatD family [Gillisia limnaea DSM 15749]
MILTDTHTHLYSEDFDKDRKEVVQKALEQGVSRFFIPAIDSTHVDAMYRLEKEFPPNIFLMMGLHPTSVKENYKEELLRVEKEFEKRDFYAVGEIGIDLYWDKSLLEKQQIAFKQQIQLAKRKKLPIVIHCRDAFDEVFEVLESEKGSDLFGIFHCFTGDLSQAKKALSYNMKLGIGGVVTFKNGGIDKFLNEIPIKEIVLETDAPYLSPAPYRGKRNESSYIRIIAEKVASIYALTVAEVAAITTQNSKDIFGV